MWIECCASRRKVDAGDSLGKIERAAHAAQLWLEVPEVGGSAIESGADTLMAMDDARFGD